jgi:hypothetical protein
MRWPRRSPVWYFVPLGCRAGSLQKGAVPITFPLLFCGALLGQELGAHNRDGDALRTLGVWAGRLKEVIPVADLVTDRSALEGVAHVVRAPPRCLNWGQKGGLKAEPIGNEFVNPVPYPCGEGQVPLTRFP